MTTLTREEANKLLEEKVAAARKLVQEAEALADEHKLSFSFSLGWRSNHYVTIDEDEEYYLENPDEKPEDWVSSNYFEPGWKSSSDYC